MISQLMNDKTRIGKENSQQKARIRIPKEAPNNINFAHEYGEGGEVFADEILRDQ
jgi:hypothetical protein